jgi:hypothetical protein
MRGEVWYDHDPELVAVDWIYYHQRTRPVPGSRWECFYTIVLDLTQDSKELMGRMGKSNAYQIRRARDRDGIVCRRFMPAGRGLLDEFERTYNRFAAVKKLGPLDRSLLEQLDRDGFLEISAVRNPAGEPLVFHAYYHDSNRSCLLHGISLHQLLSDSTARNAVGRANRYLFWSDILRHQEEGLRIFDFGGWYHGNTDQDRLGINRFKEEFGGKVIREYNCQQILTLKGWTVLKLAALWNWAGGVASSRRTEESRDAANATPTGSDMPSPGRSAGAGPRAECEAEVAN